MFKQGETVKYTFDNVSDIYELMSGGSAVIYKGGKVTLSKFSQGPKVVQCLEADLNIGQFTVTPASNVTQFFMPENFLKEGMVTEGGKRISPVM